MNGLQRARIRSGPYRKRLGYITEPRVDEISGSSTCTFYFHGLKRTKYIIVDMKNIQLMDENWRVKNV